MTSVERYKKLKKMRNSCAWFTFIVAVVGFIRAVSRAVEPDVEELTFGAKIELSFYFLLLIVGLILTIVYQLKIRRLVQTV